MTQKVNLNAYLERIGYAGSIAPTLPTLEALHALHPAAIPFENLDLIIGLPVSLEQAALEAKLVHGRRGGFCFEHNTLFGRILQDLDFGVRAYAARTLWGHPPGAEQPLSHMVLQVDVGGTAYLCDVGFGSFTLTAPLRLRADVEQRTPHETFRLAKIEHGFQLDVQLENEWHPVYAFDTVEQDAEALEALSIRIAADHHDHVLLSAARAEAGVRTHLFRNRLTIHRPGAPRERTFLPDAGALKAVLAEQFDLTLPPDPLLDPALVRVMAAAAAETV